MTKSICDRMVVFLLKKERKRKKRKIELILGTTCSGGGNVLPQPKAPQE